ncbi:ATP/GTP-binding protein [Streptomyces sp. NPDC020801]|uniref:ATP/GTP-binding protein n=1 Tax=Streptomyces sp. NPDC020801 TaxID=3365093 RepID=UPI0037A0BFF8
MEDSQRNTGTEGLPVRLTRAAIVAGVASLMAISGLALPASAEPSGGGGVCGQNSDSWVSVCAQDSTQQPGSSGHSGSSGKKSDAKYVPSPCVVQEMSPQPPPGSDLWQGHKPGDGAVYTRICPAGAVAASIVGTGVLPFETFWSATVPTAAVDPRVLAQQAVDKMLLKGPDIASPRAGGKYTVGVPVWLWVNKSATTYGPNQASASAGGITVTATARVSKIVWQLGDGSTVTCTGPGTPYQASDGMAESPTCGHRYTITSAAGGTFQLTATSTWAIDWQVNGGGETGQLTEVRQSQVQVAVGELQAVGS